MLNLLAKSPTTITSMMLPPDVGIMNTWVNNYKPELIADSGRTWGLDNGCFNGYNPSKIRSALDKYQGVPNCAFAVAPDIVSSATETDILWKEWYAYIKNKGYAVAYVLQDGLKRVPYDEADAIFVGGSTQFKLSSQVLDMIAEAKSRGKYVHVGRVNSIKRIKHFVNSGADSFDGTGYSLYTNTMLMRHRPYWIGEK